MSLYSVGGAVVCQHKTQWFLWEPAWESFRPITSIAWDGSSYHTDDRAFCSDPFDPLYGYGSAEMKKYCESLTTALSAKVPNATVVPSLAVGPPEWFYDRMVALSPCAPRDRDSWKRMTRGRYRTLRRAPRNKLTRRTLPHS
jgi:hypothetical protein